MATQERTGRALAAAFTRSLTVEQRALLLHIVDDDLDGLLALLLQASDQFAPHVGDVGPIGSYPRPRAIATA